MGLDIVTILDTETTGLDHEKDTCIEVGAVEYSIKETAVLGCLSFVITSEADNSEAGKINHIPQGILAPVYGREASLIWKLVESLGRRSDAVLAHNAEFDEGWVPRENQLLRRPWIDTCHGVHWPKQSYEGGSLINLALDHGLGVVDPHRALSDCLLIARLLTRCAELGYDLNEILMRGLRPMGWFEAFVSYENREEAKAAGFKWRDITGRDKKTWVRKMAIEDAARLPFKTQLLEERIT